MSVRQIEKDLGWKKILKEHELKSIEIKTGLFGNGNDPKNNLAYLGLIHQLGSLKMNIPKRPFVSNAFDKNENKTKNFIKNEYGKVVDGKQSLKKVIDNIGNLQEGQMKSSVTEFNYIPNKPKTILRKGSSTPLIDTGAMRQNIKYKVIYK